MPLDFPSSPVVNQTYNGYVWSGTAWESASPNTISLTGQVIVADAAARNALYPSPVQGNAVFRNDLGVEETYYGLYNVTTNPGGRTPAGWYTDQKNDVLVPIIPTGVTVSTGSGSYNSVTGLVTFTNARDVNLDGIFTSTYTNYRMVITFSTSGGSEINSWFTNNGTNIATGYYGVMRFSNYSSTSGYMAARNNGASGSIGTTAATSILEIYTNLSTSYYHINSYSSAFAAGYYGGYNVTGTTNGFKISPTTAGINMTGTLLVEGYNK